jgi:hypothetical protein
LFATLPSREPDYSPTNDYILLYKPMGNIKSSSYKLYNLFGEVLLSNTITGNSQKIEIANFPVGVYILRIYEDGLIAKSEKIVKQ